LAKEKKKDSVDSCLSLLKSLMLSVSSLPSFFLDRIPQLEIIVSKLKDKSELKAYIDFLQILEAIHQGHPEKYLDLREKC